MEKFIVLCDHDLRWCEELEAELTDENIYIDCADSIDDIENTFPDSCIDIIVCSAMEFSSSIEYEGFDSLYRYILEKNISILVIADEYSETDELTALNFGCFDYQLRSASIKAVAQRIRNRLAEANNRNKLYFDNATNSIYLDGESVKLTKLENAVLKLLISYKGNVVKKEVILQRVWGEAFKGNVRVIDTVVKQLRKKLSGYNVKIVTHYGRGVSINFK